MDPAQATITLEKQREIGETLIKLHERFGKENRGRRNKIQRLLDWRGKFNAEWTAFLDNHDLLKEHHEQLKDEYYFKEGYYDYVKAFYQDGLTKITLQETIEKRKGGVPIAGEATGNQQEGQPEHHQEDSQSEEEDAEENDRGFVTTIGDILHQGQSTPKNAPSNKIGTFLTMERKLSRKIDEIEQMMMNGLESRAVYILKDIESDWKTFNQDFDNICATTNEREEEFCGIYQQVAQRYYQTQEKIGEQNKDNLTQKSGHGSTRVKLEPVKIPKFRGSYEAWPTFSTLFDTLIISNKSLTDIERMQYLKSVVTDEAERAIASLRITTENFEKAWKILSERFDNKQAIIDNQIKRILNLENVQGNSAQQLRKFHDQSKEYFVMLKNVSGEQVLIHVLKNKLDSFSRALYQQQIEDNAVNDTPEFFFDFLHKRCRVLESIAFKQEERKTNFKSSNNKSKEQSCGCCDKEHAIYFCEKFKSMKVNDRINLVRSKSLCALCLRPGHKSPECSYKTMCPKCGKKHNGMVHIEKQYDNKNTKGTYVAVEQSSGETHTGSYTVETKKGELGAVLATATIRIKTSYGWSEVFRVLIDQGSMMTFITERAVKILNLERTKNSIDICGIAGSVESSKGTVNIELTARYPTSFTAKATAVVLNKLTTLLPGYSFDKKLIADHKIYDLILADPNFNKSGRIDLILGADVYTELIMNGMFKAEDNSFVAQETEIGWILSGPIGRSKNGTNSAICMTATLNEIDEKLQKFWELEEVGEQRSLTENEKECMNDFEMTIKRGADGVYSVSLPFKNTLQHLGNSRRAAMAQFFQMERKFEKDPNLKKLYTQYINEMIERGYLKECTSNPTDEVYYLPHHPVYKNSSTTKVRPVFNASMKTTSGVSLNDLLHTGPRLQEDLFNILVRFRSHKIGFSADIEKMYLHVNLNKNHLDYQRMLFRSDPTKPIKEYHLATVTFGVNSSPFLAVATMQHHARSRADEHPGAAKVITEDSYMDDVSSGSYNVPTAIKLQRETTDVLAEAGFPLRKWVSNNAELMEQIPEIEKEGTAVEVRNGYDKFVTTLGIPWFFESDKLGFKGELEKTAEKLTKRSILSDLLAIFDPLGLLAPVTIYNKILMQDIWRQKMDWDDEIDGEIREKWTEFRNQVPLIEKLRAPRWLGYSPGLRTEIIGFSDASESAIGACVYLKVYANDDDIQVNLIASKTKVAPMKQITLPRLELCAAELLAKLVKVVKTALKIEVHATHYYSDSKITLAWIKSDPFRWKTFVANRVARIQALGSPDSWHYINTKANPADFASRGLLPAQLIDNTLWWHGPSVLLNDETYQHDGFDTEMEEKRLKPTALHTVFDTSIMDRFSSFSRTVRTVATCKRFLAKLKEKRGLQRSLQKHEFEKECKAFVLSPDELEGAKTHIIKLYQEKYFFEDLMSLVKNREVSKTSKLRNLYPFTDEHGILRVGGRLQNSEFDFNKKHPIIQGGPIKSSDLKMQ